jgi:hypothetical protein
MPNVTVIIPKTRGEMAGSKMESLGENKITFETQQDRLGYKFVI